MKAPTTSWISKRLAPIRSQLGDLAGKMCDKAILSAYCNILMSACTKQKLSQEQLAALERSADHLIGQTLTQDLIDANTYRIMANWHFIMEGMEVPLWTGGRTDAEVLFLGCEKRRIVENNKLYIVCAIKLRTGLAAGIITRVRFTPRQVSFFLNKHSGTKSIGCAAEEISGMKARVVLDMKGEDITVVEWECSAEQKAYNKQLAEARRDVRKCSTFIPCNTCPRTTKECNLAIWLPEE